jgi:hypothetical protein
MPRGRQTERSRRGGRANTQRAGGRDTNLRSSLGAGVDGQIVPVPRALQSRATLFFRGADAIGVAGGAWVFQSSSTPTLSLQGWLIAAPNWGGAAGAYEQYKPTRVRVRGVAGLPALNYGAPFVLAYDATNNGPVAPTVGDIVSYRTSKLLQTAEDWELVYEIIQPVAGLWYETAVPAEWTGMLLTQPTVIQASSISFLAYTSLVYEIEVEMRGVE